MAVIDAKIVEKTAKLASLKLSEDEKELFAKQLTDIISYVDKISELDTSSVEATDHIADIKNVFREDAAMKPAVSLEEIEKMAPAFENGHFVVPRIIE